MKLRFRFPALAAVAGFLLAALPAAAQIDLTALSLTARSFESVVSWQERQMRPAGLVEVVQIPDRVLVNVAAVFDGPWSETIRRVRVRPSDIRLVLPSGIEVAPIGAFSRWGQYSQEPRDLAGIRPENYPTIDPDIHWNAMFRVPKGVVSATLRIGGDARFESVIQIPAPGPEDVAASFAAFEVSGVRRFRTAVLRNGPSEAPVTSTLTAPPGYLLAEVTIDVTGRANNSTVESGVFRWHTHDFRLVDGQGATLGLAGERWIYYLVDTQHSHVDVGRRGTSRIVWMVPEGLTEARLLFGETEVARVPLGSAVPTETD